MNNINLRLSTIKLYLQDLIIIVSHRNCVSHDHLFGYADVSAF